MTRARRARVLATAVARSLVGKTPIISHLLSPVCTQSSYCFHLAMGKVGEGVRQMMTCRSIGSKVINSRPPPTSYTYSTLRQAKVQVFAKLRRDGNGRVNCRGAGTRCVTYR